MTKDQWKSKRMRFLLQRTLSPKRKRLLETVSEATFLPMEAIGEQGQLDLSTSKEMAEVKNGYSLFFDGDVVVAKITPCFENGKGALASGLLNGVGYGTTELHVLTAGPEIDSRFLYYVTVSEPFRRKGEADMKGAAGQKRVPEEFILDYPTLYPLVEGQCHVADLLDRETSRIDALIAAKERLLELLAEKRRALITQAVTKGLNTNIPMRDSGLPWLGEVPRHWEVKGLKHLFTFLDHKRVPLSGEERGPMAKLYPYYGASGIIDYVEDYIFDESLILVAEDGANLFSRSTPLAFIATGKYWVNNHAHILKPKDGHLPFWGFVLSSIVYDPWVSGSAQPKLTGEALTSISLAVPPDDEIVTLQSYIERETAKIDTLRDATAGSIVLLRERRLALIAAAVTGKIDCKEAV